MDKGMEHIPALFPEPYKAAVERLLEEKSHRAEELRLRAGISSVSLAKLGKNEGVTTNVLVKICSALDCNIGDIMDVVPERGKYEKK